MQTEVGVGNYVGKGGKRMGFTLLTDEVPWTIKKNLDDDWVYSRVWADGNAMNELTNILGIKLVFFAFVENDF